MIIHLATGGLGDENLLLPEGILWREYHSHWLQLDELLLGDGQRGSVVDENHMAMNISARRAAVYGRIRLPRGRYGTGGLVGIVYQRMSFYSVACYQFTSHDAGLLTGLLI